ncbi:hypothetical protein ACFQE5_11580 [Pseudonocardia hispaniensis]|uniref:Lipoprotein n=1 Tax=Pseudonocardia hispaniensis TaxID=904933 RepID=A0ABW1J2I0_9PSEU
MGRRRGTTVALGLVVAGSIAGCGGGGAPPPAAAPPPPPAAQPTVTPHATAPPFAETVDWANQLENIESATFSEPTRIDNSWYSLKPGTQFIYEGYSDQQGERVPHRFVQTVTDLTKPINGVRTVVVWDQDFKGGELVEAEIAFNAQSDAGDVWRLGEYPQVYEGGQIVETPTWIAGIAGARAGITIKKEPQLGGPSYSQGWSPTVPWTDRARVTQVGVTDCVPQGCYQNGIVTEEFNREEPGAFQLKYYAPGVGNTRVDFTGADATREQLELIKVVQLDPAGLAEARAAALELDKQGYERSRAVYALTEPIEQPPPGR